MFAPEEAGYSSTHRELITILYSLEAFGANLFYARIKWYIDNQATAKIVEVGSMKLTLQTLAYKIFSFCLAHNIDLHIQWLPRELNTQAGVISKLRDCIRNDWQITRDVFQQLDSTWGPHTLDCFASFYNAAIERLFSRFWNPGGCLGVDAFFQQWPGENCLLVSPVNIVPTVLSYMCSQNCVGTLVVPAWPSTAFWPILWQKYQNQILAYT